MRRCRGFTLIELMMVVAIISLLSSVAIPSFVKYVRRAQASEAPMALRRMYDGAVAYYVGEHADSAGVLQAKRFPGSAGPTPLSPPAGTKAVVPIADWKSPEWMALDFSLSDPTRYSFRFDNNGLTGIGAFAQMIAQGDLDGDGVYSLYQRSCTAVADGVRGGSGMVAINELE